MLYFVKFCLQKTGFEIQNPDLKNCLWYQGFWQQHKESSASTKIPVLREKITCIHKAGTKLKKVVAGVHTTHFADKLTSFESNLSTKSNFFEF